MKSLRPFVELWVLLILGFQATGCFSTRIRVEELPLDPIALLHWEDKPAVKRSEAFAAFDELPKPPPDRQNPEAAQEREIEAYLRGEKTSVLSAKVKKYPGRLVLFWPGTKEFERVEAAPVNSRPLAWSRDHQRLLLVSGHHDRKEQLYEYDIVHEVLTPLTFPPDEHVRGDYDDQGRIALLRVEPPRGGLSVRTVELILPSGEIVGKLGGGVPPGTLRLSPAGDRIVYEQVKARPRRDGPTTFDSFVATRTLGEGSTEHVLARGREPSLTPNGEWIVFASPSSAGYRLRRMRPDGTSRVPIGPGGTDERMPSVSPDGRYIAFIKDTGKSRRLFVRRFDGKQERVLLMKGWSEFPVW